VITYSARLDVPDDTATRLVELLAAERMRRGCGVGARAASCSAQAIHPVTALSTGADTSKPAR